MSLRVTRENWDDLAELDLYWSILGYSDSPSGKWDQREFLRTGEREIDAVMTTAAALGYPHGRERALDFGCGVGRLTRALARSFTQACGVDISRAMLARAEELNSDRANCRFVHNDRADLSIFPNDHFDLIYTVLVLQHLPSRRVAISLMREFVRILKPGGLLMFHIPTYLPWRRRLQPRRRLYALLRSLGFDRKLLFERFGLAPVQLIAVPDTHIRNLLNSVHARILRLDQGQYYIADGAETGNYWVTK